MCSRFCWVWTLAAFLATRIFFCAFVATIAASLASLLAFNFEAVAAFRLVFSFAAFASCRTCPSTSMVSWSATPTASGVSSPLSCAPLCLKRTWDCSKPRRLQTEPIRTFSGVERRNWTLNSLPRTSLTSRVICSPYLALFSSLARRCGSASCWAGLLCSSSSAWAGLVSSSSLAAAWICLAASVASWASASVAPRSFSATAWSCSVASLVSWASASAEPPSSWCAALGSAAWSTATVSPMSANCFFT
mmetsp:Transcript_49465/g.137504  ORF Transcript_49465/g.137504 Transcript_49465/m.137504 type:complete len:248 (+) Transcript_49465:154-897(+)